MLYRCVISAVLALSMLAGCGGGSIPAGPEPTQPPALEQVTADQLVLRLLELESAKNPDKNVILSPLSIEMALGMAANGADGEAKAALQTLLGMDAATLNALLSDYLSREDDTLSMANSMWFNEKLNNYVNQEFKDALTRSYQAGEGAFTPYSQASAAQINGWVKEKTHDKIDSIISADGLKDETLALLINALYFNGKWRDPFEDYQVRAGKFRAADGEQDGEFMTQRLGEYFETETATGFAKEYNDGYEFVAILPKAEGAPDLAALDMEGFLASRTWEYDVDIKLPKFELEYATSLKDTLSALGLGSLFADHSMDGALTDEAKALGYSAWVSDVIHKTYMKMYEDGTEAAAVTAVMMECAAAAVPVEREVKQVFLDRPFAFLIRDTESGQTVFCGVINSIM